MTIKTYKDELVDFKTIELNRQVTVLQIYDCEVHNFDNFIETYPNVKFLTLHSKNIVTIEFDYIEKTRFEYLNFNKNVILQKLNAEKKEMEIIDIFEFGKLYQSKLRLTYSVLRFYNDSKMVFIQDEKLIIICNPYKKDIRRDPELINFKQIYFFFTEPRDRYYTLFDNLPVDLEELYFNNLEYYSFTNLPPCLKKIHLNYPNIETLEKKK